MIYRDSTFRHHLFQMSQAQRICDIPPHAGQNDIQRIMQPFQYSGHGWVQHRSQALPHALILAQPLLRQNPVASMFLLGAGACSYTLAEAPVDRMDQIVRSYSDNHQFMGSVLVAQADKVVFEKSYGDANLEWNIPDDSLTKFRIGSMTKQFTAASILLLEERGKLSTDDYVKKYMPDAPAAWDKITIYNLLTHTSGIPSFTSFPDYRTSEAPPTTPKGLVDRFRDKPLVFQPGEKWNYSNSGYILLGYLIEKISGKSYSAFVEENIFRPLEMTDSGYDSNSAIILHRASGYSPGPNGFENAGYID